MDRQRGFCIHWVHLADTLLACLIDRLGHYLSANFALPAGRVDIAWTLDPGTRRLQLTWTERNGPAVQALEKRGFGTRLIETLGKELKGDVRLAYEPGGFVYRLDVPLASLTSATAE